MSSFFLTDPLGTFLVGLTMGLSGMGGAAMFWRARYRDQSRYLGALLDKPDLYAKARRDQWLPLQAEAAASAQKQINNP